MTERPKVKREIGIAWTEGNAIKVYASKDAIEDIKEFGDVSKLSEGETYILVVDARYDFQEVVDYIKNYG